MSVETAAPSRVGTRISHYEIEELIGSGGMGVVYRATDLRLERRVALKFLRPVSDLGVRQRFLREARAASSLDHPNVCTIFEVDETPEGEVFLAMAYYEGETLDRVIARGPLEIPRAVAIAVQAGRGLAAAHEELILHRDVKPGNLMLTKGDTVKILDFGVAKLLADPRTTARGQVVGTPVYMSPEQLCDQPVDQRCDVWSLGVVLYEMLSGVPPFRGETAASVIQAVLNDRPIRLPAIRDGIPDRLDRIVQTALAKNPRARFERMDAMVRELLEFRSLLDTGAITATLPARPYRTSVAVLPFEDMSPGRDQGYLCDGIAEEILRALGRVPELYVASRTSAFQFKNRAADIREVGARLNVDHILEGSVRRAGDRVRISAQLVSVGSGYRLWDERFERDMKDIFAVEDEIAEQIAHALKVTLGAVDGRPGAAAATTAAEAYELFLQGRQFFHQHRRKAFEIALQSFSRAIELDPSYARAYAGIADCLSFLHLYFRKGPEAVKAADAASAKALELDPELPDAHAARGLALFVRGDLPEAERHLARAIELDPRLYHPHYISGRVAFSQGRVAEAAEHFRKACSIVSEAYDSWYLLGMCWRRLGEAEKARSANLECIEAVKQRVRIHPDDTRAWTMGAAVLAELGEPDRAADWVARALAVDADEPIIEYNAACVYVGLGRHEEAISCLEASLGQGGLSADWATNDPDLDPLRSHPRFQALLAKVGG